MLFSIIYISIDFIKQFVFYQVFLLLTTIQQIYITKTERKYYTLNIVHLYVVPTIKNLQINTFKSNFKSIKIKVFHIVMDDQIEHVTSAIPKMIYLNIK